MAVDMHKELFQAEDILQMRLIAGFTRGLEEVVYEVYVPNGEQDDFIPELWSVPVNGGVPKSLAPGGCAPAFSPNRQELAYLQDGQLWLRTGDRCAPVSPKELVISAFRWSGDGGCFAVVVNNPPLGHQNTPQAIRDIVYKTDEAHGLLDGSYRSVGILDKSGCFTRLSPEKQDSFEPVWAADCSGIFYFTRAHGGTRAFQTDLWYASAGGESGAITEDGRFMSDIPVVVSPDGSSIFYAAVQRGSEGGTMLSLFRMPAQGGTGNCLLAPEGICSGVSSLISNKNTYGKMNPCLQMDREEKNLYFHSLSNGSSNLYRLSLSGTLEQVTAGEHAVLGYLPPENGELLLLRCDGSSLPELFHVCLRTGAYTQLTAENEWLSRMCVSPPEKMWIKSRDKAAKICAWLVPPVPAAEKARYPAVLNIHGGPTASYADSFWMEAQVLASAGIAVIMADPRGSWGYGMEHSKRKYADGIESVHDLLDVLEAVLEKKEYIDRAHIGVTGGSYGGWTTNRLIGTTDLFRAAVAQRTFTNRLTSYGTGDVGFLSDLPSRPHLKDYLLQRAKESIISQVDNYDTPLLLLHGESDYRCGFEQAKVLYAAVRERRPELPCALVSFPGENHSLTRTGRPSAQIGHLASMKDWFCRYLCGGPAPRSEPVADGIVYKPEAVGADESVPAVVFFPGEIPVRDLRDEMRLCAEQGIYALCPNEGVDLSVFLKSLTLPSLDLRRIALRGHGKGGTAAMEAAASGNYAALCVSDAPVNPALAYGCAAAPPASTGYTQYRDFLLHCAENAPLRLAEELTLPVLVLYSPGGGSGTEEEAHQLFVALKDCHPEIDNQMFLYPNAKWSYAEAAVTWLKKQLKSAASQLEEGAVACG